MGAGDVIRDYLVLARQIDYLLPGSVDTYIGEGASIYPARPSTPPPEPQVSAAAVVRAAGHLAARLPDALGPARIGFLRGQLRAVEWTARRLAGQRVSYLDEVAAAFDTRIALGSEDAYRAAHRELGALLPGPGPLAERLAAHRVRDELPRDRVATAVAEVSAALRASTRAVVALPGAERVEYRVVDDAPWSALHTYLGGYRSRVTINAGARPRRAQLVQLVAHEAYPGHHTERCRKESGPIAQGCAEHRVVLAGTPQSLVAEGTAELGLAAVVGPGWGRLAAEALSGVAPGLDGELVERVGAVNIVLARVRQDAALLLHQYGAPESEVLAHLRRWMLVDDRRCAEVLRFLRHPLWRSYTTTYVEGAALVRRWWECDPGPHRFLRILDEPLTPAALRAEADAGIGGPAGAPDPPPNVCECADESRQAVAGKR